MPTMKSNWGSESVVRESFAPSAMVDWNGDLYTVHVSGFDSSGIKLRLKKNENGSTTKTREFYPWTYIPNTTVAGRVTIAPSFVGADANHFKNGHLWITWMNADNTKYYAFHILVKDLVGE